MYKFGFRDMIRIDAIKEGALPVVGGAPVGASVGDDPSPSTNVNIHFIN